jgi:hypothetical protein
MSEEMPTPTGTAADLLPVPEDAPRTEVPGPARKHMPEVYLAIALEAWAKAAETLCREEMARKGINGLLADPDRAGHLWLLWSLWEEMAFALKAQLSDTIATVGFEQLELFCNSAGEEANPGEGPCGPDA